MTTHPTNTIDSHPLPDQRVRPKLSDIVPGTIIGKDLVYRIVLTVHPHSVTYGWWCPRTDEIHHFTRAWKRGENGAAPSLSRVFDYVPMRAFALMGQCRPEQMLRWATYVVDSQQGKRFLLTDQDIVRINCARSLDTVIRMICDMECETYGDKDPLCGEYPFNLLKKKREFLAQMIVGEANGLQTARFMVDRLIRENLVQSQPPLIANTEDNANHPHDVAENT